jgi:hypothetical protein
MEIKLGALEDNVMSGTNKIFPNDITFNTIFLRLLIDAVRELRDKNYLDWFYCGPPLIVNNSLLSTFLTIEPSCNAWDIAV